MFTSWWCEVDLKRRVLRPLRRSTRDTETKPLCRTGKFSNVLQKAQLREKSFTPPLELSAPRQKPYRSSLYEIKRSKSFNFQPKTRSRLLKISSSHDDRY